MLFLNYESDGLFRLPPELLIRIFADVAVHRPDTFFSLGLVALEWKDFLTDYRKSIVNDISKYLKYQVGPMYQMHIDEDVYMYCELIPPKYREICPVYIFYINEYLPKLDCFFPNIDPSLLRKIKFLFEWSMDILCFPWWLPLAVKLPSPMFLALLQIVVENWGMTEKIILVTLMTCKPGDPDNLTVYEAFKSMGIQFTCLNDRYGCLFIQHLARIRVKHGLETYKRHLEILVSNGVFLDLSNLSDFYCLEYPEDGEYLETGEFSYERYVEFNIGWESPSFVGSSNPLPKRRLTVESPVFWRAWYDQLMLNTPIEERKRIHDKFHIDLNEMATYWRMDNMWEYCFNHFPGGVTNVELEEGVKEGLNWNDSRFIFFLMKRGYDYSLISRLILSVDGAWKYGYVGGVLEEEPEFSKVFYEECKKSGPFVIGFLVNGSDDTNGDYRKIPMDFYLTAAERKETAPLYLLIKKRDLDLIEHVVKEFVFWDVPTSVIIWYLETMQYFNLLHCQFLDDLIELSSALRLRETFEALLIFKNWGKSSWPIAVTTRLFSKRDNKLITDYFQRA